MTSELLPFWKAGEEERQLRIFISHRYDKDSALYDDVIKSLNANNQSVQDVSLGEKKALTGPKGGELSELELQANIAARIFTSDILIAPSRPGVTRSEWVTWEVQLAAIGYGIPILFVNEAGLKNHAQIVSQVRELGLRCAVCEPTTPQIVRNIIDLVGARPNWGIRREEDSELYRYRGPPRAAQDEIRNQYPFQARLRAQLPG